MKSYLIANDYFAFLNQKYKLQIQPFDRQLTSLERQLSIANIGIEVATQLR